MNKGSEARACVCSAPARLALTAAAVLSLAAPLAAQVTVVPDHPRIYLRPDDLESLRARVTLPAIAPYYQELKARMDGSASPHSNHEVSGFEMESLALLHVVEAPSTAYRNKLVNSWIRWSYSTGTFSHWELPWQIMGHAISLDWLWADLTPTQRQSLGNVLVAMMDDAIAYAPHDLGPNPSSANQMCDYSNQLYYHLGGLAFAGIVLSGEGIDDAKAQSYLAEAEKLLDNHMIPAMNQEAGGDGDLWLTEGFTGNGGWGEDPGHTEMTHPLFGKMVEAWRTGTGENLFPRINGLAKANQYLVYLTRPNGEVSPKANGGYDGLSTDKNAGALGCLMSARYGDAFGIRVKELAHARGSYGFHQLPAVLWYDETVPPLDAAALPRSMHFQGQGEVVVRSGFGPQDTWIYLRSGPIYNGHQHDDQGNLLIEGYGAELLIENGFSGGDPTVNHNTIRINGDQIAYGNNEVQYAQPIAGTSQERGRITAVIQATNYTYVATDFGSAYADSRVAPPKAGKVTREMVAILPDVVVVRDRIDGESPAQVLWHAWDGAGTVAGRTLTIAHASGRAWVRTVLPDDATITSSSQGDTDLLTVSDVSPQGPQTFLHLIYLSPAASPYAPTNVTSIDTATEQGVGFDASDGVRWEVVFAPAAVGLIAVRNDATPSLSTTISDCTAGEGDAGPSTCAFEVTLAPSVSQ